jgi:predicted short-subunit dehydrogenase-like oxidoreductase (DUF2520 family)
MTYTIVGTGNIAWFLSTRMQKAGFRCMGVYGRNKVDATNLASALNAPIIHQLFHIREGLADCCIIAVNDNAVEELASKIPLRKTVMIHTSGSLALDVLPTQNSAVIWCIYSILKKNLPENRDIPVVYEAGSQEAHEVVTKITNSISSIVYKASWYQRQHLHLSAVMSNNFINHLLTVCSEICNQNQIPFNLLQPIINQTFQLSQISNPKESQTGPAKRGDQNTLHRHFLLLEKHPEWQDFYEALSKSIQTMYNSK